MPRKDSPAAQAIETAGMFDNYSEAVEAWRSASQKNVDDAETRIWSCRITGSSRP